mgnify:CR=1 FL=1
METKTRTYKSKNNTVYERDTDTLSSYSISFKESEEISNSLIKFWKFIYFSEYYNKILFSILWLPIIGIMTIVFAMESFGTLPSLPFILSIVFWPMIISCIKLWKSLIKIRSQIYSNKNNFYYVSMNSKSLWFTIKDNIKWWINYYFQK